MGIHAPMWEQLKRWVRSLKSEVVALWFCAKHPSTPLAAKILAGLVAAYGPRNYTTASVIVVIWIGLAWLTWAWLAG
ncbi:MAG: hypothetical protein HYY79_09855 [Betaproteobacteria bacterium]|nr:hypothetical protein [Betaproteobacteria bacterium]